jgi:NAD(P)-dependent dehydrogenase (short-subunit alcohol dehydrogenase family)
MKVDDAEQDLRNAFAAHALFGQRVVIVGGTSGMGAGAAKAAVEAGAEIIVAGRSAVPQPEAQSYESLALDMTDEVAVREAFERIGRLDHLLVTASPSAVIGPLVEQDPRSAHAFMHGKFFGSWNCARHAAPRMSPGGSITFLSGASSVRPRPGLSVVAATFAAVETLSVALAVELGPIRVNTIRPGVIDSDMWRFLDEEAREQLRVRVRTAFPVHTIGTVDDIGHAALFLMTNRYVTGSVLEVTGGEQLVDAF